MKHKPIHETIFFTVSGMPAGIVRQFRPRFANPSTLRKLFMDSINDYKESFVDDINIRLNGTIIFQGDIATWSDNLISSFLLYLQKDDVIHIEIINPFTI